MNTYNCKCNRIKSDCIRAGNYVIHYSIQKMWCIIQYETYMHWHVTIKGGCYFDWKWCTAKRLTTKIVDMNGYLLHISFIWCDFKLAISSYICVFLDGAGDLQFKCDIDSSITSYPESFKQVLWRYQQFNEIPLSKKKISQQNILMLITFIWISWWLKS